MLINCALGLNTPPVGTTQFVGCTIGEISVGEVMKTIWPFYGALIAALMLVTYVPGFAMWLRSAAEVRAMSGTVVYVNNADSAEISVFALDDPRGTLALRRVPCGGGR